MRWAIIKTGLTVLAVMLLLTGMVALWQLENIKAFYISQKYTQEDIRDKLAETKAMATEELKKISNISVADISLDDEDKIRTGEMSVEEAALKYNLPVEAMRPDGTMTVSEESIDIQMAVVGSIDKIPLTVNDKPLGDKIKSIDDLVDEHVGLMYALKAKYVAALGLLEKQVKDDYDALPESERNASGKQKIASNYVDYIMNLEETCDLEVEEVINTLDSILKERNGDMEIIRILKDTYKQEKELKKSYYLSLL